MAACGRREDTSTRANTDIPLYPNETPELRRLINKYADIHEIPVTLLHRVIIRESTHRPGARNGPYYGLMQILPETARTMGYRGSPEGLLDAETNLKYAGRYLRGAWLVSDGDEATAVSWYARGYYYEAKRRGMLVETGLRSG
ncbi:MAG: lytic transglycosylase domain-containing protein [Pseudomonadota bacterium]